jgi:hypothetical protein
MASDSNQTSLAARAYLTKQELVARSGLSAATIQRYKDQGLIPFFQPGGKGGRILFPPDAIETVHLESAGPIPNSTDARQQKLPKLPGPRPRWKNHLPDKVR